MVLNFDFFFFNFQTYLESSVSYSYLSWLNDLPWLLYISLDVVLHIKRDIITIASHCYVAQHLERDIITIASHSITKNMKMKQSFINTFVN